MTTDGGAMQAAIDAMPDGYPQAFALESAAWYAARQTTRKTDRASVPPLWQALQAETARRRAALDPTAEAWACWADAATDARPQPGV